MKLTLRQARVISNKTQAEVAAVIGVHEQTYRVLEKNPEKATVQQAKKISEFLGYPYDIIFFDTNCSLTVHKAIETHSTA